MVNDTLLTALGYTGGNATKILLRAAAAAYLNSITFGGPPTGYPFTTAEVISMTNAALAAGDRSTLLTLAGQFDAGNNLGGSICQ